MTANRSSDMPPELPWSDFAVSSLAEGSRGRLPEGVMVFLFRTPLGLQFATASSEARHGWICRGMEKVTSTTMAAFATVDATEGVS